LLSSKSALEGRGGAVGRVGVMGVTCPRELELDLGGKKGEM